MTQQLVLPPALQTGWFVVMAFVGLALSVRLATEECAALTPYQRFLASYALALAACLNLILAFTPWRS